MLELIPFKWVWTPMCYRTLGAPDKHERFSEVSSPASSDYPYGEAATQQRHRAIDASA